VIPISDAVRPLVITGSNEVSHSIFWQLLIITHVMSSIHYVLNCWAETNMKRLFDTFLLVINVVVLIRADLKRQKAQREACLSVSEFCSWCHHRCSIMEKWSLSDVNRSRKRESQWTLNARINLWVLDSSWQSSEARPCPWTKYSRWRKQCMRSSELTCCISVDICWSKYGLFWHVQTGCWFSN